MRTSYSSQIKLLEPMNCFVCDSSPNENVGTNEEHGSIKLGINTVKVIRIHDGRGGIKSFQTSDVYKNFIEPPYRFPGYIPAENRRNKEISLIEACNSCGIRWEGVLHIRYYDGDDIYLTQSLDIWTDRRTQEIDDISFKLALWQSNSEIYTFSNPSGDRIRIVPDLEAATRLYRQQSLEFRLKSQNATELLKSIQHPNVPIAEIVSFLEKILQGDEQKRVGYQNELARAVVDYDANEDKTKYSQAALRAALVILHRYNNIRTIDLLGMSEIEPESFDLDLKFGEWFFIPSEQLSAQDRFRSSAGSFGGPNMFLSHLKDKK